MNQNNVSQSRYEVEVLSEARSILDEFQQVFQNLQVPQNFSKIVGVVRDCTGKVVTTGMGKAGLAMRKFSSTLCSFGIPSCYMHPGEASHGDLGLITGQDVLFIASTSGKTREVIEIINLARNIGVNQIIGITSHIDSPIRDTVDLVLDMGIIVEAGHLRIAPTTSILVMSALTDCLALVVAKEKGLTKEQYGKYHHGGYCGQQARGDERIY
jgi:arabinose-5-phosphate isomerase